MIMDEGTRIAACIFAAVFAILYLVILVGLHIRGNNRFVYMNHPRNIILHTTLVLPAAYTVIIAVLIDDTHFTCEALSFIYAMLLSIWLLPCLWSTYLIYYEYKRNDHKDRLDTLRHHVTRDESQRISMAPIDSPRPQRTLLNSNSNEFYLTRFNLTHLKYTIAVVAVGCAIHLCIYLGMRLTLPMELDPINSLGCLRVYRYAFAAETGVYMVIVVALFTFTLRIHEPFFRKRISFITFLASIPLTIIMLALITDPPTIVFPYATEFAILATLMSNMICTGLMPILLTFPTMRLVLCCKSDRAVEPQNETGLPTVDEEAMIPNGTTDVVLVGDPIETSSVDSVKTTNGTRHLLPANNVHTPLTPERVLELLLQSDTLSGAFVSYLKHHWCQETFMFYLDANYYANYAYQSEKQRTQDALFIYHRYIASMAPFEINISSGIKEKIALAVNEYIVGQNIFMDAAEDMRRCLIHEHLPAWMTSTSVQQMIRHTVQKFES